MSFIGSRCSYFVMPLIFITFAEGLSLDPLSLLKHALAGTAAFLPMQIY